MHATLRMLSDRRSPRRALRALAAVAVLIAAGSGVLPAADGARLVVESAAPADGDDRIAVAIDPAGYARLWREASGSVEGFPLPDGRRVDLELRPFSVIAPGASFVRVGPRGTRAVARPDVRFLRGNIAGEPGSAGTRRSHRSRP